MSINLRRLTLLAALAAVIILVLTTQTPPIGRADNGDVAEIVDLSALQEEYETSATAEIEFSVQDNRTPSLDLNGTPVPQSEDIDYRAVLMILDPDGDEIYNSHKENDDEKLTLGPGESGTASFSWKIRSSADLGTYTLTGSLHNFNDFDEVFDEFTPRDAGAFDVRSGVNLLLTTASHDFGDIESRETPRKIFTVVNEGLGELEWAVTEWPEDWLDLVSPAPGEVNVGRGNIEVRVKEFAGFGDLAGEIRIESNGGDDAISVSANVLGDPKGDISRFRVTQFSFRTGDEVPIDVRIENTGDVRLDYRLVITARDSTGARIYDSNTLGEDLPVFLDEGEDITTTFTWSIPPDSPTGDYTLSAELRNWHDWQLILDETESIETEEFNVGQGPMLSVRHNPLIFEDIKLGETATETLEVTNSGKGTITWHVVSVPEWTTLLSSTNPFTGDGPVTLMLNDTAPGGRLSGEIVFEFNGFPFIVPVQVNVIAPTPTKTAIPTKTSTPLPTATHARPTSTITSTRAPVIPSASVFDGSISTSIGGVPEGSVLIATVGDYVSPPAVIQGNRYTSLVVAPTDENKVGELITFTLNGFPATGPIRPIPFLPGLPRTVDLVFGNFGTPTITPIPLTSTPTSIPATVTPRPTVPATATSTPTTTPVPPTSTPNVLIQVVTSTATREVEQATDESDEPESGGSCNASGHVSAGTGVLNLVLLVGPVAALATIRQRRAFRRK